MCVVICFLKMIMLDSSVQKPMYTQGWLKRHCRGQKVGQCSLRSHGRVNYVESFTFLLFKSAKYHRSPLARFTSLYTQAELRWLGWSQAELHQLRIWPLVFNGHCQLNSHKKKINKKSPRLKPSQDDHRGHEAFRIINSY